MIKSLKTPYLHLYIYTAKFQINDCFENFTHEPIVQTSLKILIDLANILTKLNCTHVPPET